MIVIPLFSEGRRVPPDRSIPSNIFASIVTIQAVTQCSCGENSFIQLTNQAYPDTSYSITLDSNGFGQISGVWPGIYDISMLQFGCSPVYLSNITVNGDTTITMITHSDTPPPRNLTIDPQTLRACWDPPRLDMTIFSENWISSGFAQNQWTVTGGVNWQVSSAIGNPSPSAIFNGSPVCTNCEQYLTSKQLWAMDAPVVLLKYDIFLDTYGTNTMNKMAIEIWDGSQWNVLYTYTNQDGDIPWTTNWYDISPYAQMDFKVRFHAQNENTSDLNYWAVDNVEIHARDSGGGPPECLAGYTVGCHMATSAFTPDTCVQISPVILPYGQTCYFCVTAVYGEDSISYGMSVPVCDSVTSQYLYPPTNLQAVGIECNAFLTWNKPSDNNGSTPPGLIGYRIFRDYDFIHYVGDPDSLEYYDMDLNPGTYGYDILAVYDITPYGFPGQTDESLLANHAIVTVICGPILPFLENFNSGTFAYYEWDFEPDQGNWNIQNSKSGGTPPYADFSWNPFRTGYSYAMISTSIDATAWQCADLWLEFDLKLEDRFTTGTEKMKVAVLYDNTWHDLAEFSNNGSFDWSHYKYSISGALGMGLKVRFTATGESSENLFHWGLDNIHIYAICKAPTELDYGSSLPVIFLSWKVPECNGDTSLSGYNIYRTGLDGNPAFLKINDSIVQEPGYADDLSNACTRWVNYFVTAVFNSGNGVFLCESPSSDTLNILIESDGSIEYTRVTVFPNPAAWKLQITTKGSLEAVEMFNLFGTRILSSEIKGRGEAELDLSKINPGIYFVRVSTEAGMITRKILVHR